MSAEDGPPPQPSWEGAVDADGLPHGKGTIAYPPPPAGEDEEEKPGDSFSGTMNHGKRQGQGKYTWANLGASYEGEYMGNKKQGHGIMTFPDKSKYEGSWVDDKMEGDGTYHYANGDIYTGAWQAGKKHGNGIYYWKAHGCQFVGIWHSGNFVEGKWVHRDGTTFQGSFDGSIPNEGTFFFSTTGLVQEGKYSAAAGWSAGVVAHATAAHPAG